MKDNNHVNSIIRAFSILEKFDLVNYEIGISELQEKTKLPFSTLHRILSTMQSIGYISQNKENDKYSLGYKLLILGNNVRFSNELKTIAKPYIVKLSEKYNETVHLAIELDNALFCVDKIEVLNRTINVAPYFGKMKSSYASSIGKTILAYKDRKELFQMLQNIELEKLGPNTITDKDELIKELDKVKKLGYAVDNEELEVGLTCVGAPIFDFSGNCIAAVSVSIPNTRLVYSVDVIKDDVIQTANEISKSLGFR
ncbi:MAG TPA: IclR family transcriptional regulator [Clostridiales bacterium]|nr:IclR family transcriptional regulator [Clostridiales bacterium]